MKLFRYTFRLLALAGLFMVVAQSCHEIDEPITRPLAKDYDYKVVQAWNEKFLQIDRYAAGYRPGPGPRALGYLGIAAYQSCVGGMPGYNSLDNIYAGFYVPSADPDLEYYWPAAVNASYAYLVKRFFFHMESQYPDLIHSIDALQQQLHAEYATKTTPEILERSEQFGHDVAEAVYNWSKSDASGNNAFLDPRPTSYHPPVGPGLWQPTWPDYGAAMFPYWGDVRRFAMNDGDIVSRPPIAFSEVEDSPFYAQAFEVYTTVKNIQANGPGAYEAKWLAIFWSDDLLNLTFGPPPRLAAVADQVIALENTDLATTVELYAKLGMALSDAGVALWNSKYIYNVERPISYIRRVLSQKYPDAANWKTILDNPLTGETGLTPSFPAYPSGHSGFGGAGGKILSSFFEYTAEHPGTYTFTDLCHKDRSEFIGTPRTFSSFKEMANEDAYSRIPLGVHFRMDCDEGLRIGELAAQRVLELPWKL